MSENQVWLHTKTNPGGKSTAEIPRMFAEQLEGLLPQFGLTAYRGPCPCCDKPIIVRYAAEPTLTLDEMAFLDLKPEDLQ